ncbi:MAG: hypothetical protein GY791_16465 [Alphaproteobacteria bacterium]|nr:hypothetical protein [Alphaproteobacteria bacterium]
MAVILVIVIVVLVGIYDSRSAALRSEQQRLTEAVANLTQQLEDEHSAAGESGSAVAALEAIKQEIADAKTQHEEVTAAITGLSEQKALAETELSTTREQIAASRDVLDAVEKELTVFQTDVEELMAEQEKATALEQKVTDLSAQIEELEKQRADLSGLVAATAKELEQAVTGLRSIQQQLGE